MCAPRAVNSPSRIANSPRPNDQTITTDSGIEGVYTLGNRNATPRWLEWAKANLVGKTVTDLLPVLAALSDWGERHIAPGVLPEIVYRHRGCGGRITVALTCECGERTDPRDRLVAEVNR